MLRGVAGVCGCDRSACAPWRQSSRGGRLCPPILRCCKHNFIETEESTVCVGRLRLDGRIMLMGLNR
jgi:hypothetical protein